MNNNNNIRDGAQLQDLTSWHTKFMEGVDSVRRIRGNFSKQMRGDKQCPFSGVTNYGRVLRKGAGK